MVSTSLDEAWARAEAALPHLGDRRRSWSLALRFNGKGTYTAEALPPFMPYEEWFDARREAFGDTPAEALKALANALRTPGESEGDGGGMSEIEEMTRAIEALHPGPRPFPGQEGGRSAGEAAGVVLAALHEAGFRITRARVAEAARLCSVCTTPDWCETHTGVGDCLDEFTPSPSESGS